METINTIQEVILENGVWENICFNKRKIRAKKSFQFGTLFDKRGLYAVQINVLSKPVNGKTALSKITLENSDKKVIFKDEKILYPSINITKQEFNSWFLFIPIEKENINSILKINFESNTHIRSMVISTLIRYRIANNEIEMMKMIDNFKKKDLDLDESTPLQVVTIEGKQQRDISNTTLSSKNKNLDSSEENSLEKEIEMINNSKVKELAEDDSIEEYPQENVLMFEDLAQKVSKLKKYNRFTKLDAGYYTLIIKTLKNAPKRGFKIQYEVYSDVPLEEKSDQVLIEECVETPIHIPENTSYEKKEIYIPIDDCNLRIKLFAKSMSSSFVEVRLIRTRRLASLPMSNQRPFFSRERGMVPRKDLWSVQKTLGLKKTEVCDIELEPGCYNFFVTKVSNVEMSFRDFTCTLSIFDKKKHILNHPEFKNHIWLLHKIGQGTKHDDHESVNFEIEEKCTLQIKFESDALASPVTFFARLGKLNDIKLNLIRDPHSLFKLSAYLGISALMEYFFFSVGMYVSLAAFGFDEELIFFATFSLWLEYAEEIPEANRLLGISSS